MKTQQLVDNILGAIKGLGRRRHTKRRDMANKAIMVQRIAGTDCAATYLKNLGFSLDTALHVLSRRAQGRRWRNGNER